MKKTLFTSLAFAATALIMMATNAQAATLSNATIDFQAGSMPGTKVVIYEHGISRPNSMVPFNFYSLNIENQSPVASAQLVVNGNSSFFGPNQNLRLLVPVSLFSPVCQGIVEGIVNYQKTSKLINPTTPSPSMLFSLKGVTGTISYAGTQTIIIVTSATSIMNCYTGEY